jgi:hypothetical protein
MTMKSWHGGACLQSQHSEGQEDVKFEASLDYTVNSWPAWLHSETLSQINK